MSCLLFNHLILLLMKIPTKSIINLEKYKFNLLSGLYKLNCSIVVRYEGTAAWFACW